MKKIIFIALLALGLLAVPVPASAQEQIDVLKGPCEKYRGEANPDNIPTACKAKDKVTGDTSTQDDDRNPLFGKDGVITRITNILSIAVGILATLGIILAGFKFITSGTNPQEVGKAREMIIYAAIALVLAASAQLIVRFFLFKIS